MRVIQRVLGGPDIRRHQPIQLNWLLVPSVCPDFGVRAGPAAKHPDQRPSPGERRWGQGSHGFALEGQGEA